jgi:hypothetical protein
MFYYWQLDDPISATRSNLAVGVREGIFLGAGVGVWAVL